MTTILSANDTRFAYLVAAILFIVGTKQLSSPKSARTGNLVASVGMAIALTVTLINARSGAYAWIFGGMLIGSVIGVYAARKVPMTAMPQMVALFNGSGGAAAALVSSLGYLDLIRTGRVVSVETMSEILLGTLIGAVAFTGSLIAWGKLQAVISERAVTYPFQRLSNALLFLGMLALGGWLLFGPRSMPAFLIFIAASLLFGFLFVIPIGGGDMPVVISLLNSFTGLATAATGFTLNNTVLIISGTLVGASGTLLTYLMCRAMNRSLKNVLFSAFGATAVEAAGAGAAAGGVAQTVRDVSADDAATLLAYAREVIMIPGYGMAVAQAQHVVRELADELKSRGVEVKFAVHPVAGRMPGHMNVLLAEADVPYTDLYDLDQINGDFAQADVAVVLGANDVVNPAARTDRTSPIYGMPIFDADKAQHVLILKRSMRSGFAGIENGLFYDPKTMMLFGDAKDSVKKLITSVKGM